MELREFDIRGIRENRMEKHDCIRNFERRFFVRFDNSLLEKKLLFVYYCLYILEKGGRLRVRRAIDFVGLAWKTGT